MDELPLGIRRVTMPLPMRPGHVHCYLVPTDDGWLLVDTGLGLPDASERWRDALTEHDASPTAVMVTHFHPDHVGAAGDVHALTGAPVFQGALDYAQCELVWGNPRWPERLIEWFHRHGAPNDVTEELVGQGQVYRPFIRFQHDPVLVEPGEEVAGWTLIAAAGHADGQLCLLRDGVLLAADHVLDPISPTVGFWPASRPDPLGDYLEALEHTIALAPRVALPGHGEPIADPVTRARALIAHHRERLSDTATALGEEPRCGYDVSLDLFGSTLPPGARRFAVAETLSHLERLVHEGGAARHEHDGVVSYTSA